jgi:hypothetical protein
MDILAYGEDALTLWGITHKLPDILGALGDSSAADTCQVLFRPSFGRSGGEHSSQFGEFDFILLADHRLYLGESKWHRSGEMTKSGVLALHPVQLLRHDLFKFYVDEWAFGEYASWNDFKKAAVPKLQELGIPKPIAPEHSLLAANLRTVLGIIQGHYQPQHPEVCNVLLYFYSGPSGKPVLDKAGSDFKVVLMDYAEVAYDNFIRFSV